MDADIERRDDRELEEDLAVCQEDLELHHLLLEQSLEGLIAHTLDGELLFANGAAEQQWGYTAEQARQRGPWGWVAEEARPSVAVRVAQMLEDGHVRFESHRLLPNGNHSYQEIHSRLVDSSRGKIVISSMHDITERIEAEAMVRHLAYHDSLTGLANRLSLNQALSRAIAGADRHGDLVGVVFIDLDDFKPINDTYGHQIGDQVLVEVAARLKRCVREYDCVARVGGDEFVAVLPRLPERASLMTVARKLAQTVAEPMAIAGHSVQVSASIGVAMRKPGEDAQALLTRADLHMYELRDRRRDEVLDAG